MKLRLIVIVVAVLALVVVVVLLIGGPGGHGPSRHGGSAGHVLAEGGHR